MIPLGHMSCKYEASACLRHAEIFASGDLCLLCAEVFASGDLRLIIGDLCLFGMAELSVILQLTIILNDTTLMTNHNNNNNKNFFFNNSNMNNQDLFNEKNFQLIFAKRYHIYQKTHTIFLTLFLPMMLPSNFSRNCQAIAKKDAQLYVGRYLLLL